ncbi:hypothetical protein M9H77_35506 [Catharanthus roseus]|uniref:Uncharacterized protein n=1 Tax=Catharanthus roseus TaxID=4058 RepID=A0ACB9ZQH1_CATRO|nr:hypothetical protein M9H77_35506 [Catharanthus roseus]
MRHLSLNFSVDILVVMYSSHTIQLYVGWQLCTVALREVDDVVSGVIQGEPSSPSQIASFAKKVQTIIRRCMVSIGVQPSRRHPWEPILDRGARGVERGALRLPGGGARGDRAPAPPNMGRGGHADPGDGGERGEGSGRCRRGDLGSSYHVEPFDSLDIGFSSFQSSHPLGLGFSLFQGPSPPGTGSSSFQAPPPPGTVSSSTPHMPISTSSSSDSDEYDDKQTDVVTPAQQLRFRHRVRKKTTRFTPSDWP